MLLDLYKMIKRYHELNIFFNIQYLAIEKYITS